MKFDTVVGTTFPQPPTFVIRVDGFSTRRRKKCRVTFVDAQTSTVIAARSFDSGFLMQASLRQLMNIMGVEYRHRSYRLEQTTRDLRLATRRVSRALSLRKETARSVQGFDYKTRGWPDT